MASTSNLNNKSEYICKKRENKKHMDYMTNQVFSEQKGNIRHLSLGSGPTKMNSSNLSYNNIDIESKLRGIKSTNLEGNDFNPSLESKSFGEKTLFDNHLKNEIYMPNPFIHYSQERPGFHNL